MRLFAGFQKSMSFATFSSDTVPVADRRAVRTEQFGAPGRGELQMVVHEVLPLEPTVLAHQKMEAGEVFGRIVLVLSAWVGSLSDSFLPGAGMTEMLAGSRSSRSRCATGGSVMGDALTITVQGERGAVIAAVTGEIDIPTVSQLRERPVRAGGQRRDAHRGPEPVTFIDSAGLGALVVTACRAAAHGRSLHAVCARPQTRKLLWMTGVDRRIPLTATVDGALMLMAASRDSFDP
jgi:anti-anti-sigma factor